AAALEQELRRYLDRPRWLLLGAAVLAAAVLLAGVVAVAAFWPRHPAEQVAAGPATEPTTPLSGALQDDRLQVRIWSPDGTKMGLPLGTDPRALPARKGEQVRAEVRLNQPAHVYLLALDAEGNVLPLYPWH